jgi:hypothetical protein
MLSNSKEERVPLVRVKDNPLRTEAIKNIGSVVAFPRTRREIIEIVVDSIRDILRPLISDITPVGTSNTIMVKV